jgi:hypothetical protein
MSQSESLFCFTSNKIDSHPCTNCLAPMMLVQVNSAGLDLNVRTFACFNCDNIAVVLDDQTATGHSKRVRRHGSTA